MSNKIRNIKRPPQFEEDFQRLAGQSLSIRDERTPFSSLKDLSMLSLCIGYSMDLYEEFESGQPIRAEYFKENDISIMQMIAIAHTKSIEVLNDPDSISTICEGYINGGFREVLKMLGTNENMSYNYYKIVKSKNLEDDFIENL